MFYIQKGKQNKLEKKGFFIIMRSFKSYKKHQRQQKSFKNKKLDKYLKKILLIQLIIPRRSSIKKIRGFFETDDNYSELVKSSLNGNYVE